MGEGGLDSSRRIGSSGVPVPTRGSGDGVNWGECGEGECDDNGVAYVMGDRDRSSGEEGVGDDVGV
jgi:hypothetical protein